jgi:hypothetical protein
MRFGRCPTVLKGLKNNMYSHNCFGRRQKQTPKQNNKRGHENQGGQLVGLRRVWLGEDKRGVCVGGGGGGGDGVAHTAVFCTARNLKDAFFPKAFCMAFGTRSSVYVCEPGVTSRK